MCEPHVTGSHVLDVGCGEGYAGRRMVNMGAAAVLGVDISDEMVKRANESAIDGGKEAYLAGDATQMYELLQDNTSLTRVLPGADLAVGCFDLALGIFVFNYTTIREMREIAQSTFKLLKPGGHFVFSVPHPFMVYTDSSQNGTFTFDHAGVTTHQYFSLRDRKFGGTIKTLDGRVLNVKMSFKTLDDYFTTSTCIQHMSSLVANTITAASAGRCVYSDWLWVYNRRSEGGKCASPAYARTP